MLLPHRALSTGLRAACVCGLLLATALRADDGGFAATLSADQQVAAGLTGLTATERAALNRLIAAESAESRLAEGKVLSGTFGSRRTAAELKETGLDRLSDTELAKLNELIANATPARLKPKERPRLKDDDVISAKARPELHGSVSFTFGQGPGGTFRGADLWLSYSIPDYGLTLDFGLSRYSGGFLPYRYYPGDYFSPVISQGSLLLAPPDRLYRRDDFSSVTGRSFGAGLPWGSVSFSRSRY